jgi:predicted PurR-regulated permease PerM
MDGSPFLRTIGAIDGIFCNRPKTRDRPQPGVRGVSIGRQIAFWLAALVALGLFLHLLGGAVTPFALGMALGYLLDPIVQRLERLGLNRLGASILILVVFVILFALIVILVAPILGGQLVGFTQKLPSYVARLQALAVDQGNGLLDRYGGPWRDWLGMGNPLSSEQIQKSVGDLVAQGGQWLLNAMRSLASGGAAIFSFLSILIVTPVVAFYMLVDWDKMLATIDSWLPLDHRDMVRRIAGEINHALAGFMRGQALVCLALGLWYGIGLSLIRLDFGFLIGMVGGLLSFIPYLGGIVALVLALGVAIVQGWPSWSLFFLALAVVGVGQFLEGNVLAPRLVGKSIGLHPVWLMFALVAFGNLFGFAGLLIAVPMSAAIAVLARHLLALYLVSPIYRGHRDAGGQAEEGRNP